MLQFFGTQKQNDAVSRKHHLRGPRFFESTDHGHIFIYAHSSRVSGVNIVSRSIPRGEFFTRTRVAASAACRRPIVVSVAASGSKRGVGGDATGSHHSPREIESERGVGGETARSHHFPRELESERGVGGETARSHHSPREIESEEAWEATRRAVITLPGR